MNAKRIWTALLFLAALIGEAVPTKPALAQTSLLPDSAIAIQDQPKKDQPKKDQPKQDKKTPDPKTPTPPQTDIFAQGPSTSTGGQTLPFFNPQMMGDFSVYAVRQYVSFLATQMTTTSITTKPAIGSIGNIPARTIVTTATTQLYQSRAVWVPDPTRGAFNIAENESPIPQDRVFITGNYFNDVRGPVPNTPLVTTTTSTRTTGVAVNDPTITSKVTTVIPGAPNATLYREIFGFEKTFFDGAASVEIRVPVLQQSSEIGAFADDDFGDLTIIGKYAFYMNRTTGNVISGGLAVTAPSSGGISTTDGEIHSTLIQPFVGYLWNFDRFYIQAFHSVVVPTDSRDVTLLFNDIGLNYWLYRNQGGILSFIVPTLEAHVTTALNHRGENVVYDPLYVPDTVVITTGVHFGLFKNATLSVGAATPVTAPRFFGVEGFVQLNWRY